MNIALIGYGKMGKEIESIAKERNHNISLIIDINNSSDLNSESLKNIDVAIEFTNANSAPNNYKICFNNNIPVVSGTTAIPNNVFSEIENQAKTNKKAFFWASNFSVGVNITFELNKQLAKIMNQFKTYDVRMTEIHHTQKIDSPSGTAITLAEEIIENIDSKNTWINNSKAKKNEIEITSERTGNVPGTHIVEYFNDIDTITLKHEAHNRKGFALGAVLAAEFIANKTGLYNMSDLLNI